jgi:WG containing repeat
MIQKLIFLFLFTTSIANAQTLEIAKSNGLTGIRDKKTKVWQTPPTYTTIDYYRGNLFIAKTKTTEVLIDANGKDKVIAPCLHIAKSFAESPYFVCQYKEGYKLYEIGKGIDETIGFFKSYSYSLAESEQFEYLKIVGNDGKCGMIYPTKTKLIYDTIFNNLIAVFHAKYGKVNSNGETVIPFEYDSIENFDKNAVQVFITTNNKKMGLINKNHRTILPAEFDAIDVRRFIYYDLWKNVIPVKKNGLWGIADTLGTLTIPIMYDSIIYLSNENEFIVIKNKKQGIVNLKNELIYPFTYSYIETNFGFFSSPTFYTNKIGCTSKNDPESSIEYDDGICALTNATGETIMPVKGQYIRLNNDYKISNDSIALQYAKNSYEDFNFNYFLWSDGGKLRHSIVGIDSIPVELIDYDKGGNEYSYTAFSIDKKISYNIVGGKLGIITKNGKTILPFEFDDLYFHVMATNYKGEMYSLNRSVRIPDKNLQETYHLNDTSYYVICKKNKKFGLANWQGKMVLPIIYDSLYYEPKLESYDVMETNVVESKHAHYYYVAILNKKNFIFNSMQNKIYNPTVGFDSLSVDADKYVAYIGKKVNVYSTNYKGAFDVNYDYMYPSPTSNYQLVISDAKYTWKQKTITTEKFLMDNNEEAYSSIDTVLIPYFTFGLFNLKDYNSDKLLLPQSVNEIKFPTIENGNSLNLLDSTSFIYQNNIADDKMIGLVFEELNHGIAIREGITWKIMGIHNPLHATCCFDSVWYKEGFWYGKKGAVAEVYEVTESGIQLIKKE